MMSTGEYLSLQIRRPQQIQRQQQQYHHHQPIAEEIEFIGHNDNKNVIINEDDGKEYYLNDEEGIYGKKHSSSFGRLTPSFSNNNNNQSKKQKVSFFY
jgi:hypothetical protein